MRDIQSPLAGVAPTTSGAACENHAAGPAPSNAPLASVGDLIEAYMAPRRAGASLWRDGPTLLKRAGRNSPSEVMLSRTEVS